MSVAAQIASNGAEDTSSPFYFNPSHWRAIDGVKEGVRERAGLMVLTGPTGSGKTMLMRAISDNLDEGATPLFLQYASLNFREFVNFLHKSLHVEDEVHEASNKAVALRKFLYLQAERDETAVVFIDEAQNLEPDVLRMLPKLACFDTLEDGRVVGLQFVLIGGSELREFLDDAEFDEVRSAVAHSYELRFFTRDELKNFLEQRLEPIARMTPEPITDEAVEAVGKYTGGSPRLVSMICSHAMLFAAENPGRSIDAAMIEEAAEAQMIEPIENPFAHEDEDYLTGPYSSADLKGGESAPATESIIDSLPESFETSPQDGEGLDQYRVADAEVPDSADLDGAYTMDDIDETFGDTDDEVVDSDFSGSIEDEEKSGPWFSRLTSVFGGRLGTQNSGMTRIIGAGRKGGSEERQALPSEKRWVKARVAGANQKKVKYGLIACGVAGLGFVAWLISGPVMNGLSSAGQAVSETASRTAASVSTAAAATATRVREAVQPEQPTTIALTGEGSVIPPVGSNEDAQSKEAKGGWGAKVDVKQSVDGIAIPAPAVNLARNALDMADIAIGKGTELAPKSIRGALDVAAQDVESLRQKVTGSEVGAEEQAERIVGLLTLGDKQFENRLYIAPRGGNSYETYRKVLDIDPGNEQALNGVEKLRAFYAAKADKARAAQEWDRANRHFETALTISKLKPIR